MLRDLIHPESSENFCDIRYFRSSKPSENGPKTAESEQSANAKPAKPAKDRDLPLSCSAQHANAKPAKPAPATMPSRPELEELCRRAVADFPDVSPDRLRRFLEVAQDPEWATEPAARQIARRMHEGLIRWPEDE